MDYRLVKMKNRENSPPKNWGFSIHIYWADYETWCSRRILLGQFRRLAAAQLAFNPGLGSLMKFSATKRNPEASSKSTMATKFLLGLCTIVFLPSQRHHVLIHRSRDDLNESRLYLRVNIKRGRFLLNSASICVPFAGSSSSSPRILHRRGRDSPCTPRNYHRRAFFSF